MPSQDYTLKKNFGALNKFLQHFSEKENSTQTPETMDGLLPPKTNALNIKQFTTWLAASSLGHLSYLFQNSQFPEGKPQLLFPSAAPKTLLIPEWDQ